MVVSPVPSHIAVMLSYNKWWHLKYSEECNSILPTPPHHTKENIDGLKENEKEPLPREDWLSIYFKGKNHFCVFISA